MKTLISLAHDLNNKLTIVAGNLLKVLQDENLDKRRLEAALFAVNRAAEITKAIQNLSDISGGSTSVQVAMQSSEVIFAKQQQVNRFFDILNILYKKEISVVISSEWDMGWNVEVVHPAMRDMSPTEHADQIYDLVPILEECLRAIQSYDKHK